VATFTAELALDPDAVVNAVTRDGDAVAIRFMDGGVEKEERFDYLVAATGRRPNVDTLGLETTRLALDNRGAPAFDRFTMQCGDSHVFVAGDANGDIPLLHEAADQGRIAGDNAAGPTSGPGCGVRRWRSCSPTPTSRASAGPSPR